MTSVLLAPLVPGVYLLQVFQLARSRVQTYPQSCLTSKPTVYSDYNAIQHLVRCTEQECNMERQSQKC